MIYIDCFKLPSNEEINEHFARNSFSVYPWTIFFKMALNGWNVRI